jgi:hypothetical protein
MDSALEARSPDVARCNPLCQAPGSVYTTCAAWR